MPGKDYYAILGVSRTASEKEIKQAYRRLARKHHPDVNPGDKQAEAHFKEINNAYEVLADPEKRKKYDLYGEHWQQADQFSQQWPGAGGRRGAGAPGGATGFGGIDFDLQDIFGGIFGERSGRARSHRGQDLEHHTEITLEEAYHGSTRVLQLQSEQVCSTCRGTGAVRGVTCGGCQGMGVQFRPKRLEIKVPPGAKDGARIRVAGEGQAGLGGGPKGDLYLVCSLRPHDRFERRGDDLHLEVQVPLVIAVLGGEVQIPTLRGSSIMLKVPPETQNGQVIRLAGLGMPLMGNPSAHGDLYARVKVLLPVRLTAEQKKLFEALRAAL
ncbi:MAG: J domain-containing protein [Chloroflexi bacterium]|nr:J domain-containing protein [Chloroflexota bacterium]